MLTRASQSTTGKVTDWVDPSDKSGEFKRQVSSFRDWISNESGAKFPAEKGRYHLYISYACPWVSGPCRKPGDDQADRLITSAGEPHAHRQEAKGAGGLHHRVLGALAPRGER